MNNLTKIDIHYEEDNQDIGHCKIEVANEQAAELILQFQAFFNIELLAGEIIQKRETTSIRFSADKSKMERLEKVIQASMEAIARLN